MRFHRFHHSPRALLLSFLGGEWSVTHLTSTYNASLLKMEMVLPVIFLLLIGEHSANLCVVLICSDWDIFSPTIFRRMLTSPWIRNLSLSRLPTYYHWPSGRTKTFISLWLWSYKHGYTDHVAALQALWASVDPTASETSSAMPEVSLSELEQGASEAESKANIKEVKQHGNRDCKRWLR